MENITINPELEISPDFIRQALKDIVKNINLIEVQGYKQEAKRMNDYLDIFNVMWNENSLKFKKIPDFLKPYIEDVIIIKSEISSEQKYEPLTITHL